MTDGDGLRPLGPEADGEWDALAGADPRAGFMQSSFWAAFKRVEGYETRRYGWFRGGRLGGGATLHAYPAPGDQPGFVVCPEGPVLDWDDEAEARAVLRALLDAARRDWPDALGLRVEPHLPPPRPRVLRNWQRAPTDLTPVHTRVLDLSDDETLLAGMRPKGRYNLRLAARHGVSVREVTGPEAMRDLGAFHDLFADTARRQGFFAEPFGFFLNLGATLFPAGHASLLFAERGGEVLAAALVVFFGRRATYLYGGSSPEQREVMAPYALHWAAIQEARARGCAEYDLYGIDPFGDPYHLYAGISTFKQQFGGRVVSSLGAHDCLFYDRLAGHLLRRLPRANGALSSASKASTAEA